MDVSQQTTIGWPHPDNWGKKDLCLIALNIGHLERLSGEEEDVTYWDYRNLALMTNSVYDSSEDALGVSPIKQRDKPLCGKGSILVDKSSRKYIIG